MSAYIKMEDLYAQVLQLVGEDRCFVAIAGAPGSGKSTTVETLWAHLEQHAPGQTAILPMDGFHYDDSVLHKMARRPWKGAPDTFDVGGLRSVLQRLKTRGETVAVPVFDRALEISRGSARLIDPTASVILVEGNYLLLDDQPWSNLHPLFDLKVMLDVPEEILTQRLKSRWEYFDLTEAEILQKLEGNDLPNGRTVREKSVPADLVLMQ
jgi:pantothenate kinase